MKKFYSIAAAAVCTLSAAAGNFEVLGEINREALREVKPSVLERVSAVAAPAKAMAFADNAPSSLVGKTYVNVYSDRDNNKYNGVIDITAAGDSIVLGGFVEGYDVKAVYDAATGTITIPTGYVIANHSTYGPITMWALDVEAGKYSSDPIIGTVDGNTITFNLGVYSTITMNGTNYYVNWMQDMKATEANGSMTLTLGTSNYSIPLSVTKTSETSINVVGISSLIYGGYYSVPVNFDASANTATISSKQPVDVQITSSATNIFYILGESANGLTESAFNVSVTDDSTVVAATSNIWYAYPKSTDALSGTTTYSGYKCIDFKINVDFNIYTAKVESGSTEFDPNPTIENVNYSLDTETKTAEVTGCMVGITTITIPSTLNIQGVDYTVTSIKKEAFMANKSITTISLPATIKTVGQDAFRNVTNLRTLYIEDLAAWCAVEFVNGNANPIYNVFPTLERNWGKVYFNNTLFEGELTIPAGVTSIGRSFYGLKSLTKVNIPEGVKTIGDQTFANATKLTDVVIPSSVVSVGSAFFGCSGLASVTLPEGLETMGSSMFYGCKALTTITIPASVKSLGSMALCGCSGLKTVKSLNTVPPTCAGYMTFDDCETATLMVPAESMDAYKAADGWKEFTTVEALQTTGVDLIEADVNAPVEYYNLQGVRVDNPVNGVFIKRQGSKVAKVYVK